MFTLLFGLLVGITVLCLVVLFFLTLDRRARVWYVLFLASFAFWVAMLYRQPAASLEIWLLLLPMVWIAGTLIVNVPNFSARHFFRQPGEPRATQEQLLGPAGTREALTIYFAILVMALSISLFFFYISRLFQS